MIHITTLHFLHNVLTQSPPTHPEVNAGHSLSNCLLPSNLDLFTLLAGTKHFEKWTRKQEQWWHSGKVTGDKNHPASATS